MSVNGASNARLAVANLVHGVSLFRWARSGKDELSPSGLHRVIRGLLSLRRSRRAGAETLQRDALARNKATRERFERLLAQTLAPEEPARRLAWLRQARQAMQELDALLSGSDPRPNDAHPTTSAADGEPAGGRDE